MNNNRTCYIWGTPATVWDVDNAVRIDSSRAGGRYSVSHNVFPSTGWADPNLDSASKARLTTWLNNERRLGTDYPEVNTNTIEDSKKSRSLPVREKADRLLRFIAGLESYPGSGFNEIAHDLDSKIFSLALSWIESSLSGDIKKGNEIAKGNKEIKFFSDYLQKKAWIEIVNNENSTSFHRAQLTVDGYARLAELEENYTQSAQAFIAMWFDDSMHDVYDKGIKPAVRNAGYEPIRIDQKEHISKIDDEIIAEIRRSRFVVADFTHGEKGARGGVYYEAGFAHGLNIPVIFSCREDSIGKVHLDTRQYNHILWKTPADLRDRLAKRIAAIFGDGPVEPLGQTVD